MTHQSIRDALQRMITSPFFKSSEAKIAFLSFVVKEALAGRASHIKAYNIAVDGLGYEADFNPQTDSRIRVLAGRVRQALETYYETEGAEDPVVITLSERGYVPVFSENDRMGSTSQAIEPVGEGVKIGVWPFSRSEDEDGTKAAVSDYIGEALSTRLGLFSELTVTPYHTTTLYHADGKTYLDLQKDLAVQYLITGRVMADQERYTVFASLMDIETATQLWAQRFDDILAFGALSRFEETVVKGSIGRICGVAGVLINQNIPKTDGVVTPEYAMSQYATVFQKVPTQGIFRQVEAILMEAVSSAPMNAMLHAMLSEVYLTGFFFGYYDDPKAIQSAEDHLTRALEIDPNHSFTCFVDAYRHFARGNFDQAKSALAALAKMSGDDIFLLDFCGFGLFVMGAYDTGLEMIERAEKINPFLNRYNQLIYCQNHLRLGQPEKALAAAERFYIPDFFWSPLLQAVALAHNGRLREAKDAVDELLRLRPDFSVNAHIYLRFMVVTEPIITLFHEGLDAAGLSIVRPSELFHLSS